MAIKKKDDAATSPEIVVPRIKTGALTAYILGEAPLLLHHGSVRTHLMPAPKLTKVERNTTLKHEPIAEWKERMILSSDDDAPTRLMFPAAAFKGAMMKAALRLPGMVMAEIAQLVFVEGERVPIYGVPRVHIREVRMADMARTPDARTRPILSPWACRLEIRFIEPMMTAQAIVNLIQAAGLIIGVGDWRPEKGKGTFGQFTIVDPKDSRYEAAMTLGRAAQDEAIANPVAFDAETLDTLTWYDAEVAARTTAGRSQKSRRANGAATH